MLTKIQSQVMKKIYLIWFFKRVLPYVLGDVLIFTAFIYLLGQYTFVRVIMENFIRFMLSSPSALLPYFIDAITNTKFVVQISLAGSSIAVILALKNVLYSFIQMKVFREETNLKRGLFY